MSMNPYDVDYSKFKESKEITDPIDILKVELIARFLDVAYKMERDEVLAVTKLDKSDFSRIQSLKLDRFSVERLMRLTMRLGYKIDLKISRPQDPDHCLD
jgi:predicted XRE-type DNA-binding protein